MAEELQAQIPPAPASGSLTEGPGLLDAFTWRCIGPFRGGRVVAVAGHPTERAVFYFGACAGGVWKTVDGGTYWENVSDGFFRTAAVGAVAVSESDPSVVYAGMGEGCIRGDVSHGDGVYRTTDGGRTWTHRGLADTRTIGRVRVHPRDADLVYVAALGHAYGPNEMRGVFRSRDGGGRWERVLFRGPDTGAIDLAMDPTNPRRLYATTWQVRRTPWSLASGGPGSGLHRSTDGGDTWQEVSGGGFPAGLKGRIGVTVSPARPDRLWAIVEAEDGGLFRSDDAGATWQRLSEDRSLRSRPWYYCHVFADPTDPDTVYVLNVRAWKSVDGGRTFGELTTPHGDNHDLWIDPRDPARMVEGNDGGACVSYNGGESWSTIYNQPTAQFYHVITDDRFPYRVYGTQQDNSAISVPSRSYKGAILWSDCYPVGSSESGHLAVHPTNPDVVFSGAIGSAPGGGGVMLRYDHATGQTRIVTVWPELYGGWGPKDLKYRFQWTYPIFFSPHDPRVLYTAGNVVFRSVDEGGSWEPISPDLTRDDPTKLEASGGPITRDTTGAEHYCTVFALAESPREPGTLWAGSDDGLVHVSTDGGASWRNVTPPGLPEWSVITVVEPSRHDPATVYLCATRYKLDDPRPYLFRTRDRGRTWESITAGIPDDDFTRVIREDPVRPGLLYAGTETGVYVSLDDGAGWRPLRRNLPVVPVYDLVVKDGDLVAATHGRSFWILDDVTPLQQLAGDRVAGDLRLFGPRPATRLIAPIGAGRATGPGKNYHIALGYPATFVESKPAPGETVRRFVDAGSNPPDGALITYWLGRPPAGEVTLRVLDPAGAVVKTFSSAEGNGSRERRVPAGPGMNRFLWNLRYPDAREVPGDVATERLLGGPAAPPGRYTVEVSADGRTERATLEVRRDPQLTATDADYARQFALLIAVRDKLSEVHDAINRMRAVRTQAADWSRRAEGTPSAAAIAAAAKDLGERVVAIEQELIEERFRTDLDVVHYPSRLNLKLASLTAAIASADAAPTRQAGEVFAELSARIDAQLERWRQVREKDVADFNRLVRDSGLPPIG